MKKLNFIILLSCFLLLFNSANTQELAPLSKKEFDEVKILTWKEMKIPEILFVPTSISISNNKLLIIDEGDDYYFHIYSYPNVKEKGKYGKKGEGPNEINFSPVLSFFNGNMIEFFSFSKNSIFDISLDCYNAIDNNANCIQLSEVLPPELINPQIAIKLDDSTISGYGVNGGKIFFYDTKSDNIQYYTLPFDIKNIQKQNKNIIYQGCFTCNPDKNKIVFAALYFNDFIIFGKNGQILQKNERQITSDNIFMKNGKITTDDTKMYYTATFATNKHIYLLFVGGNSTNDLMTQINNNTFKCEIQKYDWEGKPLAAYIIDKPARSFCVSEVNHQIIIINPLSEDNPIICYPF